MASTEILLAIIAVLGAIYIWSKYAFNYWKRNNMPYVEPTPIIGNTKAVFQRKVNLALHFANLHNDPKVSNESAVGIYVLHSPGLLIRSPELIKSVLVKDFNKFSNRKCESSSVDAITHYNLFFSKNPIWKQIRSKLTPVFTSGKVKQMYPLMLQIASDLEQHLSSYEKDNTGSFVTDTKEICGRFTTDLIATISFGIRANSLYDPNAKFRQLGRKMTDFNIKRAIDFFFAFFFPALVSVFRIKLFPTESTDYFRQTFSEVIADRETSGNKRNDLIDILVGLKREAELNPNEDHVGNYHKDALLAQAVVFYVAGFETSSSTMSFALYELARHPDLQKRLRKELQEAFIEGNGKLSYEKLNSLEYLSMVVDETLRIYPIIPYLDRQYEDIKGEPSYNLKPSYNYTLPNGLPIFISVYALHNDPQYWSNPHVFDPERFSKENRGNITDYTYMPFGEGNRNCIGRRIGLLQSKIGLVHFLKNHHVELYDKSEKMVFDPNSFNLQFQNVLKLKVVNDNLYGNSVKM